MTWTARKLQELEARWTADARDFYARWPRWPEFRLQLPTYR